MLKRLFDILVSFAGLAFLSPLFAIVTLLIKMDSAGPVFYRGRRVGRLGRPFRMYKFRTMVVDAERAGGSSTPEDDSRITRCGKFLRKYKFDELPQLINVLLGNMSFVGPRPQVQWAVDLYSDKEMALLNVSPGITDYASVKFSNEGDILRGSDDPDKDYLEKIAPEKIRLGLEYVRTRSLLGDLLIILKTFKAILGR